MLVMPQDIIDAPTSHGVYPMHRGCIVLYSTSQETIARPVFAASPTLVHVRAGEKKIRSFATGEDAHARAGDVLLIAPGVHAMTELLASSSEYSSTVICLETELVTSVISRVQRPPSTLPPSSLERFEPDTYLRAILASLPLTLTSAPFERSIELKLEELILGVAGTPQGARVFAEIESTTKIQDDTRFKLVMERNYHAPLFLQDYAKLIGVSVPTFKRTFTRLYDESPGKWLIRRRLALAASLLETPSVNVTQACYECGFNDLSNFIRSFKRTYNTTPKQYQRTHRSSSAGP